MRMSSLLTLPSRMNGSRRALFTLRMLVVALLVTLAPTSERVLLGVPSTLHVTDFRGSAATTFLVHSYDEADRLSSRRTRAGGIGAIDGQGAGKAGVRTLAVGFASLSAAEDAATTALDATPSGRQYTAHYLNDTGPGRNIPGSVVDETIDHGTIAKELTDRTIFY